MNSSDSLQNKVTRLTGQVEDLLVEVRELVDKLPQLKAEWLKPCDFAKIAGCSTKSLSNWRKAGKIKPGNWQQVGDPSNPSFKYHRDRAFEDIQQICRPSPKHLM